MGKHCVFCKSYHNHRQFYFDSPYDHVFKVALVCHTKINGELRGRSTNYNARGIGFKLNYCPECGADLRGGQDG